MNYRQAIQEMFDVNIECDASTYEYYIEDPDALQGNGARVWALNTLAVSNMLNESQELRNRWEKNCRDRRMYGCSIREKQPDPKHKS